MNAASVAVLAVVIALAVLAVCRNIKKGSPCECGGGCACARPGFGRRKGGCRACDACCGGDE